MVVKPFVVVALCFLVCATHIVYGNYLVREEKSSFGSNVADDPLQLAIKRRAILHMGLHVVEELVHALGKVPYDQDGGETKEQMKFRFINNSEENANSGIKNEEQEGSRGGIRGSDCDGCYINSTLKIKWEQLAF